MLLSLLSKRSLNADFRDAYGFNVRPQHLQRYKEYIDIYKDEEEERLHKWKVFLEQQEDYIHTHSELDEANTKNVHSVDVNGDDNSVETNHISDVQTTSDPEKKVVTSDLKEEVPLPPQAKRKVVQTWSEIRSSLGALDYMMSFRVKNDKIAENGNIITAKHPLRDHSEDGNVEKLCLNGKSDDSTNTSLTEPEPFFPWKQELEFLVQGGVPRDLRGEVWQALVGARSRRVEKYYQDLLVPADDDQKNVKRPDVPQKWKKQIEKDLPRTFPGHPALNEKGRDSLRRLLLAYARHNPSVGYCQAMNFFAGVLLLMMPEENAFWTLVGFIDDYFDGYFSEDMTESQVDQLVFEEIMRERFPKLANHLDYLGIQVTWITAPWFLSIFVNIFPWESVLRVWDVILFEGNRVMLFRTALAVMELYGPAVVTTQDAGDAICSLQTLTGSTFDSSQLVLTACMGFNNITEDRLQGLRKKHRPSVLAVQEERIRGDIVCKQTKSLATKLASFKRGPGPVTEESENDEKNRKDPLSLATKLASFKHNTEPLMPKSITEEISGNKKATSDSHSANQDEVLTALTAYSELDSITDIEEQVVWLRVELSKLLEEKRSADLRAEELETALMEMVKEDNRRELTAKVESLEREVSDLRQVLSDQKEQETALLQVLMRMEHEQKVTEDARIRAEKDTAAQRIAARSFQEKYVEAMASVIEGEKKVVMAESLLEATLQYQSGKSKALSSPRATTASPTRTGLLSFGLNWRDRNKGKSSNTTTTEDSNGHHDKEQNT